MFILPLKYGNRDGYSDSSPKELKVMKKRIVLSCSTMESVMTVKKFVNFIKLTWCFRNLKNIANIGKVYLGLRIKLNITPNDVTD